MHMLMKESNLTSTLSTYWEQPRNTSLLMWQTLFKILCFFSEHWKNIRFILYLIWMMVYLYMFLWFLFQIIVYFIILTIFFIFLYLSIFLSWRKLVFICFISHSFKFQSNMNWFVVYIQFDFICCSIFYSINSFFNVKLCNISILDFLLVDLIIYLIMVIDFTIIREIILLIM